MKPPMPYSGGKQAVADWIVSLMPPHRGYIEPFAGALSVLLAKPKSEMETVNDLDGAIVAFWRVLRDRPEDLERVCALTPHSRAEMLTARDLDVEDAVEKARRVWVMLTQHRSARLRPSGWRFVHGANRKSLAAYLTGYVGRIAPAAERIREVSLECRDAIDVINAYGQQPDNLLYIDPPYLGSTRSGSQYRHELVTDSDHERLLEAILACKSAVMLSGYAAPLYDRALASWNRFEASTTNVTGADRTEVLWTNRTAEPFLFDMEAPA